MGLDVVSAMEAWANTATGMVLHTTDGGTTWSREQTGPDPLYDIAAVGKRTWVSGWYGTILASGGKRLTK